jgi:hypothetical protein
MWDRRDINKYMRKLEADKDADTGPTLMEPKVEEGKAELAAFCAQPETLQPVDDINIRLLVHLQMADMPLQVTDIEVMLHVPEFSQVLFSFGRSNILPRSLHISLLLLLLLLLLRSWDLARSQHNLQWSLLQVALLELMMNSVTDVCKRIHAVAQGVLLRQAPRPARLCDAQACKQPGIHHARNVHSLSPSLPPSPSLCVLHAQANVNFAQVDLALTPVELGFENDEELVATLWDADIGILFTKA